MCFEVVLGTNTLLWHPQNMCTCVAIIYAAKQRLGVHCTEYPDVHRLVRSAYSSSVVHAGITRDKQEGLEKARGAEAIQQPHSEA